MDFDTIRSDFALLDEWEDRYRYLIELGRALPPVPAALKTDATKVRGCASRVWLVTRRETGTDGQPVLRFSGESDAHIVQGLIAVLIALVDGRAPATIARTDILARFAELGLAEHLTPQRSNGLAAMAQRVRADASAAQS